jgi:hypothetical protein
MDPNAYAQVRDVMFFLEASKTVAGSPDRCAWARCDGCVTCVCAGGEGGREGGGIKGEMGEGGGRGEGRGGAEVPCRLVPPPPPPLPPPPPPDPRGGDRGRFFFEVQRREIETGNMIRSCIDLWKV